MRYLDKSKVYDLSELTNDEKEIFLNWLKKDNDVWSETSLEWFEHLIEAGKAIRFSEDYAEWVFSDKTPTTNAKELFDPQYEVTMIAEQPKNQWEQVYEIFEELSKNPPKAYKEKSNKLDYELDFNFITQLAERMNANKGKYEPYNWQKLDNIEDLKQALFRHVMEVMKCNYEDDKRSFGHLEAIALNCMFINYQLNNKNEEV